MPTSLQSDNGPEFTAQIIQNLSKSLSLPWHLHCPYRPQASGKVERANRTLKDILTKLSLELHLDWVRLLPLALLRIRALPKKPSFLSPFEIMYGRPILPPGLPSHKGPIPPNIALPLLSLLRTELWKYQDWLLPDPSASQNPPVLQPGQLVFYKPPEDQPSLTPKWEGPHPVILCTPSAAKLSLPDNSVTPWIHISRLKPNTQDSPSLDTQDPSVTIQSPSDTAQDAVYSTTPHPSDPLKLRISRAPSLPSIPES